MRLIFLILVILAACGTSEEIDAYSISKQEFNGNPPPVVVCQDPKINCSGVCVDISRDMKNCGWCGQECDITSGEFCLKYTCRNVSEFGFSLEPNGPRQYDVRKDLPRPIPMN